MSKQTNSLISEYWTTPSIKDISIFNAILAVAEGLHKEDSSDENEAEAKEGFSREEQKELVTKVSEYLGTNPIQTLIFCVVFALKFDRSTIMEDIARGLGMSPVDFLRNEKELEALVEKGFVDLEESYSRFDDEVTVNYRVSEEAWKCISDGKELKLKRKDNKKDVYFFFDKVSQVIYRNKAPGPDRSMIQMKELEEEFKKEPYVKALKKEIKKENERFIIYMLSAARVEDMEVSFGAVIRRFYKGAEKGKAKQLLIEGKHPLQEGGYVELEAAKYVDKSEIYVTEKALRILMGEDAMCFTKEKSECSEETILPEKISEKELYYTPDIQFQMDRISSVFEEENFKALQERLEKKGMHKGVAVLFHGEPGTGKTESVFQFAKRTGRGLVQVDISETKTMWFGESERLTKKIFTRYRKACEDAKVNGRKAPILFINEADAIISKRRTLSNEGGAGQTENALQNIFLEEIENLEGILVATTNLVTNMDEAFDRRFLFKVCFEKPDAEIRAKIWKSKLSFLSDKDALILSENFQFSGGQIDNIARKIEIEEVITGEVPGMEALMEMCRSEVMREEEGERRVGFCA